MNTSTSPRRGRLLLLLLAAVLIAAGIFGYHNWPGLHAEQQTGFPAVYDANTAMTLAGVQVPAKMDSYYFFYLDTGADEKTDTADLADKLARASKEKDYLGITGPDPDRNLDILRNALKADAGKSLEHMTLVYVGPDSQHDAVNTLVADRKFTLRYVTYP